MHLSNEHHRRRIGSATKKNSITPKVRGRRWTSASRKPATSPPSGDGSQFAAGTAVVAPAALPSTPDRTIYHPWERARRCRARVQSVHITRSGHTQRANERAHFQPATRRTGPGVCSPVYPLRHVRCTHAFYTRRIRAHTQTHVRVVAPHRQDFRQVSKGWRMIATGRKDDESGSIIFSTSHRWSTLSILSVHWCDQARGQLPHGAARIGFRLFQEISLSVDKLCLFHLRENSFYGIK